MTNKKPSLADQIRDADDRPTEEMEIPEWGGVTLTIRALSAWQQSEYENSLMEIEADDEGNISTRTVVLGAAIKLAALGIQDAGITETLLRDKSPAVVGRIAARVRELSGMDPKSRKAAEKN